jgi:hypothetical protein
VRFNSPTAFQYISSYNLPPKKLPTPISYISQIHNITTYRHNPRFSYFLDRDPELDAEHFATTAAASIPISIRIIGLLIEEFCKEFSTHDSRQLIWHPKPEWLAGRITSRLLNISRSLVFYQSDHRIHSVTPHANLFLQTFAHTYEDLPDLEEIESTYHTIIAKSLFQTAPSNPTNHLKEICEFLCSLARH